MSGESTDGDGQQAIASYIAECKEQGINVLPPDINKSGEDFVPSMEGINYRITMIRHVGDSAIQHINSLKPIKDFDDFLERKERKYARKNVVVSLIKAGAFDFDNPNRAELLWKFDMSERTKTQVKDEYQCEQYEWNDKIKCEWEKEVLGLYLSLHPMQRYGFRNINTFEEGSDAIQGGEVIELYEFHPKKDPTRPKMAFVTIDTLFGMVKLVVFANVWANDKVQEALTKGNLVLAKGKRQGNDILMNSVEMLEW